MYGPPKVGDKTKAGVIVKADESLVNIKASVDAPDVAGKDNFYETADGMLQSTLLDARGPDPKNPSGPKIAVTMTLGLGAPMSAGVFQPGESGVADYRTDYGQGSEEIAPRQSFTVPSNGGVGPVEPVVTAADDPLLLGIRTLEGGGKIVPADGGGKKVVGADGHTVLAKEAYANADKQAVGLGTPDPGAQYWFTAVQQAGDPNVGGNPGGVAGSEG